MDRIQEETKEKITKIITQSLYKSALRTYNLIGGFLGGFVIVFFSERDKEGNLTLNSIFYGILVFLILWLIISLFTTLRKLTEELVLVENTDKYGKAIKLLSFAFADLHEYERHGKFDLESMVLFFEKFSTLLKHTFDDILPVKCNVCIKIVVKNEEDINNPRIITFARDLPSKMVREPNSENSKHFVDNNSCYKHFYTNIGKKKGDFYLNNNLIKDSKYMNSSHNFYGNLPENCASEGERLENWKLPYKSELVVPIVPLNTSDPHKEIIGFLCIDANEIEVFAEKYDPYLLLGTADGIYNVMKLYYENDKN